MRKLFAKCDPKCLKAEKNRQRCQSSEQLLNFFGAMQMIKFRARLVTMNEILLYQYDPETKQQSMEWWHSGSRRPKICECKNPLENFSHRFFGDQNVILLIDYLPKSQDIKAEYYSSLLLQF
jgi:hypothetical protein